MMWSVRQQRGARLTSVPAAQKRQRPILAGGRRRHTDTWHVRMGFEPMWAVRQMCCAVRPSGTVKRTRAFGCQLVVCGVECRVLRCGGCRRYAAGRSSARTSSSIARRCGLRAAYAFIRSVGVRMRDACLGVKDSERTTMYKYMR